METKKITPQEFMKRLRERAEKAKAEGKTAIPAQHAGILQKLRERAEQMKAEGKTVKAMPAKHSELFAKLRERAMLAKGDLKKVETAEKTEE